MQTGNYVLVLHTHLPWVLHHGSWPHGEDWLTEAAAECYIPLLNVFNDLLNHGILPKVTIDISPILCEQLEHPDFKIIFDKYCNDKILSAINDERNFTDWGYDPHHIWLANYWQNWYRDRLNDFVHKYDSSIIKGLKKLQDEGAIEIMTCGLTHGYLPLLPTDNSVDLQVHAAAVNYKKHFGRDPKGIWLPECAYRPTYDWHSMIPVYPYHEPKLRPGIEQILSKYNIDYFITDEDLLKRSGAIGKYQDFPDKTFYPTYSDQLIKNQHDFSKSPLEINHISSSDKVEYGTAMAFTRYHDISMQVWSGLVGYPGEPDYLDFHKKHLGSMLRYWRVTDAKSDMMYKTLYHPDWTKDKIDKQSNHFIHHIENSLNWNNRSTQRFGTLCTPFDTELFGHWWFEGPEFIKAVLKGISNSPYVKTATCSEQIIRTKPTEIVSLPEGSWGKNNNHDVWMNDDNKWTWEVIYNNENRFKEYHQKYATSSDPIIIDMMTQALRELTLLESSDWQFLIFTESAKDYAEQRFSYHHSDFNKLLDLCDKMNETKNLSANEQQYFESTKQRNCPFQELKLDWWKH
jgi:1,4-alpha-glucan branching enzyme